MILYLFLLEAILKSPFLYTALFLLLFIVGTLFELKMQNFHVTGHIEIILVKSSSGSKLRYFFNFRIFYLLLFILYRREESSNPCFVRRPKFINNFIKLFYLR